MKKVVVSYEEVKVEIEGELDSIDITATNLQDEFIGPIIFE